MTLFIALGTGLSLIATSIALQMQRRKWRRLRLKHLELRPNCLLTRHPLLFINPRRSLFRLFGHWNDIPLFLREHGYEVLLLDLPVPAGRHESLLNALTDFSSPCHVIGDSSLEEELTELAQARDPHVASITLVRNGKSRRPRASSEALSIRDLKPLNSAIEILDVSDLASQAREAGHGDVLAKWLLKAHNLLLTPDTKVDGFETGEFAASMRWEIECRFLDLAVSLAERDAGTASIPLLQRKPEPQTKFARERSP